VFLTAAATLVVPVEAADAAVLTSRDLAASWKRTHSTTAIQEWQSRIRYTGSWRRASNAGYSNKVVRSSGARNATAAMSFTGSGVAWIGPKGPSRGQAKIYVDGRYVKTVNLWARSFAANRVLYQATWSRSGSHSIKIKVVGTRGHPYVSIDAFVVRVNRRASTGSSGSSGGGSTRPCSNLQGRINAARSGSVLDLSGCSFTTGATISKPMTLRGATIQSSRAGAVIRVTADNVTLDRLRITGPQATRFRYGENGVHAAGSPSNRITGLVVKNSTIRRFGYGGIYVRHASGARLVGNRVEDVVYSGIMLSSTATGRIEANTVRRVGLAGSSANSNNAYGITVTQASDGGRSSDVVVIRNTVERVPGWHALDTHGGIRIRWESNIVRASRRALFLTSSPQNNVVVGNRFFAPTAAQKASCPQDVPQSFCNDVRGISLFSADGTRIVNNRGSGYPSGRWFRNSGSSGVSASGNAPSIP
jgi:parallel beta-helix repeat protein